MLKKIGKHLILMHRNKTLAMSSGRKNRARLVELERRVDLALKGLNLLLFREAEEISAKEKKVLEQRLGDYTRGNKSKFVELKDLESRSTRESD